jgi:hypothetical protein
MDAEKFNGILESRVDAIRYTLAAKSKEYAIGDRLYNFKRAAEISRTSPQKALAGMFVKHLVSVIDLIEGNLPAAESIVNEKIGDAINYLVLLEAVLAEAREQEQEQEQEQRLALAAMVEATSGKRKKKKRK